MSSIIRCRSGLTGAEVMWSSWVGALELQAGRAAHPRRGFIPGAAAARPCRGSGLVVCPACSIAWGCKSPIQPDGGEGLAKHKGSHREVMSEGSVEQNRDLTT